MIPCLHHYALIDSLDSLVSEMWNENPIGSQEAEACCVSRLTQRSFKMVAISVDIKLVALRSLCVCLFCL